jgi:AraC-like DNA-binding protein
MDHMVDGRVIVMRPETLGAATIVDCSHVPTGKPSELIAGHDSFLFIARGDGSYRINGHEGRLRPNTLIAAPAGTLACNLSDDRELYVITMRDLGESPDDPRIFTPFFEHQFTPAEGRQWHARIADLAVRAESGRFFADDIAQLRGAVLPLMWRHEPNRAQETIDALFADIWTKLDTPLSLQQLAEDVGYTANYLNDLTHEHTGRSLGRWITDMRMSRARATLERTDEPVAQVAAACGYDDPAYFSRAFRRAHGVSPVTWRIAARPVDARHARVAISLEEVHAIELWRGTEQRAYSFAS